MKVTLFRDLPTERWRSMERYADELTRALQLFPDLITFSDKRMALIHCLSNCLDAYGQFLERGRCAAHSVPLSV